jgi:hypothetical protein
MSLQQFATYKSADFVFCYELLGQTNCNGKLANQLVSSADASVRALLVARMLTAGALYRISQKRELRIVAQSFGTSTCYGFLFEAFRICEMVLLRK